MATTWQRMQDLIMTKARLYGSTYNPLNLRTGAKVLRQRLKGPAVAAYYPPRTHTMRDLRREIPELVMEDDKQLDREEQLAIIKARGKGAPKKKRSAAESKRAGKKGGKPVAPKPAPPAS